MSLAAARGRTAVGIDTGTVLLGSEKPAGDEGAAGEGEGVRLALVEGLASTAALSVAVTATRTTMLSGLLAPAVPEGEAQPRVLCAASMDTLTVLMPSEGKAASLQWRTFRLGSGLCAGEVSIAMELPTAVALHPGANGLWAYHPQVGGLSLFTPPAESPGRVEASALLAHPATALLPPTCGATVTVEAAEVATAYLAALDCICSGGEPIAEPGDYGSTVRLPAAMPPEPDCAKRFHGTCAGWYLGGSPDAIGFEAEDAVVLTGVYMYGDSRGSKFSMKVSVHEGLSNRGTECIYGPETLEYEGDGANLVEVDLNQEVIIDGGSKYCIVCAITGPQSNYGNDGKVSTESETGATTIKWHQTDCSDNGTGVGSGQIGGIRFHIAGKSSASPTIVAPSLPAALPKSFAVGSDWALVEDLRLLAKQACDELYNSDPLGHPAIEVSRLEYVATAALRLMRHTINTCPQVCIYIYIYIPAT